MTVEMPKETESVDGTVFLSRLSEEISTLEGISLDLQGALHNLPLAASDSGTRKVLQSADKLSQSLACLGAALQGLSDQPLSKEDYDLSFILEHVFLEDMRERLIKGSNGASERTPAGEIDLF